jgi:hypothetical protein
MPSSGLKGPHSLDEKTIDTYVTLKSAGAYALGKTTDNTYYISYVGRSDDDINGRLKDWVGKYAQFKFEFYPSPKAAFEKECNLYHDFGPEGLDNKEHPDRPENADWQCPRCDCFKGVGK